MRREHARARELLDEDILDLVGIGDQLVVVRQHVAVGEPHRDAVVGPQRVDRVAEVRLELLREHERPRRVDPAAERRQDADANVAELVAEPLDRDRAVGRDRRGRRPLVRQVLDEVVGGVRIEPVVGLQPRPRPVDADLLVRELGVELARERAERHAELDGPAGTLAAPERHLAGLPRGRRHDHPIARDVLDPPRRRPEDERLALAALRHHLLVELADPGAGPQVHGVRAAVGNRAARHDRQQPRALAADEHVRLPVPREPRPQLRELVRRVAPGQHVEHADQGLPGQLLVACRPPDHALEIRDRPRLDGDHRDDLLREHVERAVGHADRLHLALEHLLRDDGRLEQIAAELRHDPADRHAAHVVTGAADALQAARYGARRLDLDHQVDRPHVDPELERARRDDRAQPAALERLLDLEPLVARHGAVMRAHELHLRRRMTAGDRELRELLRGALREPARVHEHDRRAVREDELEQARVDHAPHALARTLVAGTAVGLR